jgi:hypothetical protein
MIYSLVARQGGSIMTSVIALASLISSAAVSGAEGAAESAPPPAAALPPFWKSTVEEIDAAIDRARTGKVRTIARSPGGRPVRLIEYGPKADLARQANYGSAAGAGDPAFYARKTPATPPIVYVVGPVHGQEVEGMVGIANLLGVVETGKDLRGKEWPRLRSAFLGCRAIFVPLPNPDGRARCPRADFVGVPVGEMTRLGQGTRKDGTFYGWPGVKERHPMTGDVGLLGAYFNDRGINLMHDDFFAPMADETRALLEVARDEAPDWILVLHSHGAAPAVLPAAYVPRTAKEAAARFAGRLYTRLRAAGLPVGPVPAVAEDGATYPPPSFNLASALHHACGGVPLLFECPHGLLEKQYPQVRHEEILDIQLILLEELFTSAIEVPRPAAMAPQKP